MAESPRETDQTFVTAAEDLEAMPLPQEQDQAEVSSPIKQPAWNRKPYKRQVEELQQEAISFVKKSKTLAAKPSISEDVGSKTRTAAERAARAQQRELRKVADNFQDAVEDTEASQALLDLAQGQAEPATSHDNPPAGTNLSLEGSQSTSSQADKIFAAAWATTAGPARLAADWRSSTAAPNQAASSDGVLTPGQEAVPGQEPAGASHPPAQPADQPVASPLQTRNKSHAQPAQSQQPGQSPQPAPDPSNAANVAVKQLHEVPSPASGHSKPAASTHSAQSDRKQAAADAAVKPDKVASPSAQPYVKPVTRAQSRTPQSAHRALPRALLQSPEAPRIAASTSPAGQDSKAGSLKQGNKPALASLKKAARQAGRSSIDPAQASPPRGSTAGKQREQQQPNALEERALQLAMQRLMDEELRQKQADEALLQSTPAAQLMQVPVWSNCLAPAQAGENEEHLEGILVIPKDCSVRLMRRMFARAAQIQPCCVEFGLPGSKEVVQDFEAGQEVGVGRYRLQNQAGGLQVRLRLQEGCAQVQALIDREVALVKHQLLAARLNTPPAATPAGPTNQAASPARQFATAAVLESHGWGATSPAKRVTPAQKPAQAGSRHMADYEAMLPAQKKSPAAGTVPMVSPGRRKIGRWDEAEVDTLIRKMEAGHTWAKLRDEWPTLGFAARSAVDIKDKWRNLEDAVLKGKIMRNVTLSSDQRDRILRCHRKYRSMLAAVPDPLGNEHGGGKASQNGQSSPVTEQGNE